MTIQASGIISISDVNNELKLPRTTTKNLNSSDVRTLLKKSAGQISLSDAYGKNNIKVGFNMTAAAYSGFIGTSYGWAKGAYGNSDTDPVRYSPDGVGEVKSLTYWDGNGTSTICVSENLTARIYVIIDGVEYAYPLDYQDGTGVYYTSNFSYSNPFQPGRTYNIGFRLPTTYYGM